MNTIATNLANIRKKIIAVAQRFDRSPNSVQLLAVSKAQTIDAIQQAISAGQNAFAENYIQEALPKIIALADQMLEWHFIGVIQANKTKLIAENFHWVHSIDNLHIAERLNKQRPSQFPPLNICIQVNIDNEPTKAGVQLEKLPTFALAIAQLPRLKLRGLMTIPAPRSGFEEQRKPFLNLHLALNQLEDFGLNLDTLSMGMSNDYEAAIAEGATIVRLGTAIFGERTPIHLKQ